MFGCLRLDHQYQTRTNDRFVTLLLQTEMNRQQELLGRVQEQLSEARQAAARREAAARNDRSSLHKSLSQKEVELMHVQRSLEADRSNLTKMLEVRSESLKDAERDLLSEQKQKVAMRNQLELSELACEELRSELQGQAERADQL